MYIKVTTEETVQGSSSVTLFLQELCINYSLMHPDICSHNEISGMQILNVHGNTLNISVPIADPSMKTAFRVKCHSRNFYLVKNDCSKSPIQIR